MQQCNWGLLSETQRVKLLDLPRGPTRYVGRSITDSLRLSQMKQRVIEQDSIGDEIQTGVDVVLSIFIRVGKVAHSFLSIAAETVQQIVETVHVCEMIDLWSLINI